MGDRIDQIRQWEAGERYPDHDTFSFGHGFGTALLDEIGDLLLDQEGEIRESLALLGIYGEVRAERQRAHTLHGDTSMESYPVDSLDRLAILTEEVGEVAKEFNEARHDNRSVDLVRLRKELVQTAAMAAAWADSIETRR